MSLTQLQIEQWNKRLGPFGSKDAICDGQNLWLTRKSSNNPVWVLRYRFGKRRREITIGAHQSVGGLAGARKEAALLRGRIAQGEDVATAKSLVRIGRSTTKTYRQLFEDYMKVNTQRLSKDTVRELNRMQSKDVLPKWQSIPINQLVAADVTRLLRDVRDRSYTVARRLWEQVGVIFAHGVANGDLAVSPCVSLKISSVLGGAPKRKQRIQLTQAELREILSRLTSQGEVNELASKILLYSCVRKSELLNATWADIDFANVVWNVPAEVKGNKARRAYVIPLAPAAVGWFKRLKELAGRNEMVLPPQSRRHASKNKTMSASTLNNMFIRISGGS